MQMTSRFEQSVEIDLHAELVDIEALARATEAAADALPAPETEWQRLLFGRIQSLATKASEQASASLRYASAQVTAFAIQEQARRRAAER